MTTVNLLGVCLVGLFLLILVTEVIMWERRLKAGKTRQQAEARLVLGVGAELDYTGVWRDRSGLCQLIVTRNERWTIDDATPTYDIRWSWLRSDGGGADVSRDREVSPDTLAVYVSGWGLQRLPRGAA